MTVGDHKKHVAQAALESLSLIGFLTLTTLILTTSLLTTLQNKNVSQQEHILQTITKTINTEVQLAANAPPGYTRNITIPTKITGHQPTITITKNPENGIIELTISLPTGMSKSTLLPPQLYGTITTGTNTITKNTQGTITITPQQPTPKDEFNANTQTEPSRITTNKQEYTLPLTLNCTTTIHNLKTGDYTIKTTWTYTNSTTTHKEEDEETIHITHNTYHHTHNTTHTLTQTTWPESITTINTKITCNQTITTPQGEKIPTQPSQPITIQNTPPEASITLQDSQTTNLTDTYTEYLTTCLQDEEKREALAQACEDDATACNSMDDIISCPLHNLCDKITNTDTDERLPAALTYSLTNENTHQKTLRICTYETPSQDQEYTTNHLKTIITRAEQDINTWITNQNTNSEEYTTLFQAYCELPQGEHHCKTFLPNPTLKPTITTYIHTTPTTLTLTDPDNTQTVYTISTQRAILNTPTTTSNILTISKAAEEYTAKISFNITTIDVNQCSPEHTLTLTTTDKSMNTQTTNYTTLTINNGCPTEEGGGSGGGEGESIG